MSQHDCIIGKRRRCEHPRGSDGTFTALKSNIADPGLAPSSPVQDMTDRKAVVWPCQEAWEYDGATWRLRQIINPTSGRFYPAGVRAISGLTLSNNGHRRHE
jgi:hypothetical protein